MRALVLGANGLIGSRLLGLLFASGHQVVASGRGPCRVPWSGEYQATDITDHAGLDALVAKTSPDVVFLCAALTDVDRCEAEPEVAYATNVEAVVAVARALSGRRAHLLYVSTDYVFDGLGGPYTPDSPPNPLGVYATTKAMGEGVLRLLFPAPDLAICRTASVVGWPPASRENFGSRLVARLQRGEPSDLYADQWGHPTHAGNAAAMIAEIGTRRLQGIWHTAGASLVSRLEFGHLLASRMGARTDLMRPVSMAEAQRGAKRPRCVDLDVSRSAASLAAQPWPVALAIDALLAEKHATDGGSAARETSAPSESRGS